MSPLVSLKKISQGTWLGTGGGPEGKGLCYYMCNYIEGPLGPWNNPVTFDNACDNAANFGSGVAMYNAARSALSLHRTQRSGYGAPPGGNALEPGYIYRAELFVGAAGTGARNHEIILIVGDNNELIYYDPNFGFYRASEPGRNNWQALEYHLNNQYHGIPGNPLSASNFGYFQVRAITSEMPKGYD